MTKWLFDLEMLLGRKEIIDDIELEILHRVSELLPAATVKLTPGRHCLAAELARLWAGFYDDTWVWGGKTPILSSPVLLLLAFPPLLLVHSFSISRHMFMCWQYSIKEGIANMSNHDSYPPDRVGTPATWRSIRKTTLEVLDLKKPPRDDFLNAVLQILPHRRLRIAHQLSCEL